VESRPFSVDAGNQGSAAPGQAARDERRRRRDEPRAPGTTRGATGLSGEERRALLAGWAIGAAVVAAVITFNILTRRHDHPDELLVVPVWDEVSSALMTLVAFAIPAAAAVWTWRTKPPWWRAAPVHLAAALAYCVGHVGGFVVLRMLGFSALGLPYRFGPLGTEVPYEFGKDVVAYALSASAFWAALRWRWPLAPAAAPAPLSFDIRDGARLVRIPMSEILAVRSAGNYVEFLLSDGRQPIMRASLAGVEAELSPNGFVRTHRSWLVNAARVTGLRPEGSGDYVIELGSVEAPLSRRWRDALATLRA
jgi:DNA-binding LytR/AlgR family response regulator